MSMTYKGYSGSVEYSAPDRVFHGKLIGITDIITFEGTSVEELERDFRDAVDDYLASCSEQGMEPQKPYSGKFVLRLSPEVHQDASIAARRAYSSMNSWIIGAIQMRLAAEKPVPRRPEVEDERLSDAAGG
jgi:predicted HicB family RNase H-like nuclease